jgi:N-acylneuraminate cytidylyltransferase
MKTINWNGTDRPRRQESEDVFVENGAFYITSKKNLLKSKSRYSGNIGCIEMSLYRSFQLDTYDDLEFLRKIISNYNCK